MNFMTRKFMRCSNIKKLPIKFDLFALLKKIELYKFLTIWLWEKHFDTLYITSCKQKFWIYSFLVAYNCYKSILDSSLSFNLAHIVPFLKNEVFSLLVSSYSGSKKPLFGFWVLIRWEKSNLKQTFLEK
ncbi:hypothetical protein BpHYR1_036170 [Brachionus plicatilis]|uniref:Uncharacterized protein n=1 Tax=Brachionus plicatilis TaxID=10195 RepID=A0A3M7PS53_BRAPC|nr:hypothetical protein BpHYR1_036170 [Brachionus plicatilis]